MKIDFSDRSYLELTRSSTSDKLFITIAAKSADQSHTLIVNSIEITESQLLALIKSCK